MNIRVALVDDQSLIRTGLRMILEQTSDIEVEGEAGNGAEALDMVRDIIPDVVLMDVRMPGMDGIEATARIAAESSSGTRVLILTTLDLDEYVYAGLRAGASGFMLKDALAADLISAIRINCCRGYGGRPDGNQKIDRTVSRPTGFFFRARL